MRPSQRAGLVLNLCGENLFSTDLITKASVEHTIHILFSINNIFKYGVYESDLVSNMIPIATLTSLLFISLSIIET